MSTTETVVQIIVQDPPEVTVGLVSEVVVSIGEVSGPPGPAGDGAGVLSVVAGTNVTVDDTDPQNPVVSATGGGGGVSLGETSTTAYRGDRGKTAYDHSQTTGNPHGTTAAQVPLPDDTLGVLDVDTFETALIAALATVGITGGTATAVAAASLAALSPGMVEPSDVEAMAENVAHLVASCLANAAKANIDIAGLSAGKANAADLVAEASTRGTADDALQAAIDALEAVVDAIEGGAVLADDPPDDPFDGQAWVRESDWHLFYWSEDDGAWIQPVAGGGGGGGAVDSVNGETGAVDIFAAEIGAATDADLDSHTSATTAAHGGIVPSSRTFAGLDLTTNRSLSDLISQWTGTGDYLRSDGTKGTPGGGGGGTQVYVAPSTTHAPLTVAENAQTAQAVASNGVAVWYPCYVHATAHVTVSNYCWTLQSGSTLRFALWTFDTSTLKPGTLVQDLGTVSGASTGAKSATASTSTVSGYFFIGIYCDSVSTTVRWNRANNGWDFAGCKMFGATGIAAGQAQFGWHATGLNYDSAWNSTLPTLVASTTSTHAAYPFPNWSWTP